MNTRHLFRILAVSLAALLALAPTGSAFAMPPTVTPFQFSYETQWYCGNSTLTLKVDGEGWSTQYYDSDGQLVRSQAHSTEAGMISNPQTGKAMTYSGTFISTYDARQGTTFLRGQVTFAFILPAHGAFTDGGTAYIDANGIWTFGSAHPHLPAPRVCEVLSVP